MSVCQQLPGKTLDEALNRVSDAWFLHLDILVLVNILNEMRHTPQTTILQCLCAIDETAAKKHALSALRREVKKSLQKLYRNTEISIVVDEVGVDRTGIASFERDFSAFVEKKKRVIIVNNRLDAYSKTHRINRVRPSVQSIMGVPMFCHNESCGVIILLSSKKPRTFTNVDASLVALHAGRLAAEISYDRLSKKTRAIQEQSKQLNLTDPLTSMPNRRFFDLIMDIELRKARGYSRQLSLAMITIDHKGARPSKRSRQYDDLIFAHVARTLKGNVRDTDFVARFSRDEFAAILPEAVNEAAVKAAERVRRAVERTPFIMKGSAKKKVTISLGVVTYPSSAESLEALLQQARKALERARNLGRNQVVSL